MNEILREVLIVAVILMVGISVQGVIAGIWSISRLMTGKYAPSPKVKYFIPIIGLILLYRDNKGE